MAFLAGVELRIAVPLSEVPSSRRFRRLLRRRCALVGGDEVANVRIDLLAPAAAGKDAVVAGADGVVVKLPACRHAGAEAVRGSRLPDARDVVELAFDRQQGGRRDVLGPHQLALDLPGAVDQGEVLEHRLDRVEVVLGGHVEHGVVFVVEAAVELGFLVVAANEVEEVVVVRLEVPIRIHGNEAGVLQEAGVDGAASARIVDRHVEDDVVLEPCVALVRGQVVDRRRALASVDRAAHHGHRARRRLAIAGHQRDGREHRHGRLADRDHVDFRADVADEFLHVGDVVVEVERPFLDRHHARVGPVGDVYLVILKHLAHGFAQQRRVVAGEWRDDENRRLRLDALERRQVVGETLEAEAACRTAFPAPPVRAPRLRRPRPAPSGC